MRDRLARALWRLSLRIHSYPACPGDTCRELRTRIGSGASRAERRRAGRAAWAVGGKGK